MAKFRLRGVSFSCSLIVVAVMFTVLTMFDAAKVHQGASHAQQHARLILILTVSCLSVVICMFIFWPYCRGGYRKVEKVAVYHTLLTIGGFIVRIGLDSDCCFFPTSAQQQRQQGHTFEDDVDYSLLCRLQVGIGIISRKQVMSQMS
ncbi:hypothetical protein M9X92_011599 [Pyricularia oryzae]|nr:hypothetical protein M9X92_011599 [Pyricularia oryzae]